MASLQLLRASSSAHRTAASALPRRTFFCSMDLTTATGNRDRLWPGRAAAKPLAWVGRSAGGNVQVAAGVGKGCSVRKGKEGVPGAAARTALQDVTERGVMKIGRCSPLLTAAEPRFDASRTTRNNKDHVAFPRHLLLSADTPSRLLPVPAVLPQDSPHFRCPLMPPDPRAGGWSRDRTPRPFAHPAPWWPPGMTSSGVRRCARCCYLCHRRRWTF